MKNNSKKDKIDVYPGSLRRKVFQRDNYRCVICGKGRDDGLSIEIDARIPLLRGGEMSENNLRTVCAKHHKQKSLGFISIKEVVELTGVPAPTIFRWSSRGIISKPIRQSFGSTGTAGFWPVDVVEEIKLIRKSQARNRKRLPEAAVEAAKELNYHPGKDVIYFTMIKPGRVDMHPELLDNSLGKIVIEFNKKLLSDMRVEDAQELKKEIVNEVYLVLRRLNKLKEKYRK